MSYRQISKLSIALLIGSSLALTIGACSPRSAQRAPEISETGTANLTITIPAVTTTTATAVTSGVITPKISPPSLPSRQMLLDSGRVFFQACAICHGGNGRGGRGPTLANSDYVQGDKTRLIRTVLEGVYAPIYVNGVRWKTGEMLGWGETWPDFKIAAVLTYIRSALNDSTVTFCIPEDFEAGTWASCTLAARAPEDMLRDTVGVDEVAAVRKRE